MPEESTTPDLVELAQRLKDAMRAGDDPEAAKAVGLDVLRSLYAAWERGGYDDGINADLDVVMSLHADDAVYDRSPMGLGVLRARRRSAVSMKTGAARMRPSRPSWRSFVTSATA
jgi:hypothetical protein